MSAQRQSKTSTPINKGKTTADSTSQRRRELYPKCFGTRDPSVEIKPPPRRARPLPQLKCQHLTLAAQDSKSQSRRSCAPGDSFLPDTSPTSPGFGSPCLPGAHVHDIHRLPAIKLRLVRQHDGTDTSSLMRHLGQLQSRGIHRASPSGERAYVQGVHRR